ncbi:hypothetical protein NA57DRAFT_78598 [Rhizodiscina lignyota]|uniref:Uncharacterized protein n=1 Tax=Rhizodiscina lignyota TaxID=1504668 RepID=A0A9P4IAR3_9PEZI|nr:hypothetical protein NA57DRAFT_78598 [Rhizodiscina lignyota]
MAAETVFSLVSIILIVLLILKQWSKTMVGSGVEFRIGGLRANVMLQAEAVVKPITITIHTGSKEKDVRIVDDE